MRVACDKCVVCIKDMTICGQAVTDIQTFAVSGSHLPLEDDDPKRKLPRIKRRLHGERIRGNGKKARGTGTGFRLPCLLYLHGVGKRHVLRRRKEWHAFGRKRPVLFHPRNPFSVFGYFSSLFDLLASTEYGVWPFPISFLAVSIVFVPLSISVLFDAPSISLES